jgi:leucine-rich melanocyte differentiation-associated protein
MNISMQSINSKSNQTFAFLFRLTIIRSLPSLKFLDSREVSVAEQQTIRTENEPKANFEQKITMQLMRMLQVNWTKAEPKVYSPLPDSIREAGDHKGMYSKTRYRYIGAQSEGNRFIANNDL